MTDVTITRILGRRVWDSRGRPTAEAEVHLAGGASGGAIAPAGASTGSGEAVDRRDGGAEFGGFDVRRAVVSVNTEIAAALRRQDASDQAAIDERLIALDGTPNKARLGGNAIIATSMAVLQAAAQAAGQPQWRYLAAGRPVRIPVPEIQIFGGAPMRPVASTCRIMVAAVICALNEAASPENSSGLTGMVQTADLM